MGAGRGRVVFIRSRAIFKEWGQGREMGALYMVGKQVVLCICAVGGERCVQGVWRWCGDTIILHIRQSPCAYTPHISIFLHVICPRWKGSSNTSTITTKSPPSSLFSPHAHLPHHSHLPNYTPPPSSDPNHPVHSHRNPLLPNHSSSSCPGPFPHPRIR